MSRISIVLALAALFALAACDDDENNFESRTVTTLAPPEAAPEPEDSVTTAVPATPPDQLASEFVDAYSTFDADRALAYLTDGALATGEGNAGSWGSADAFRMETALAEAQGVKQLDTDCATQGESSDGTSVRCAFSLHAYGSDAIGHGPYGDNYWDIVVRDGKITSAVATWAYLTNGVSNEMWTPLQAWVTRTHPEDLQTMYPVGDLPITEEMIEVWDARTREYAAAVNAGTA
jgi:hypothetical protein